MKYCLSLLISLLMVVKLSGQAAGMQYEVPYGHVETISSLDWSPDGRYLLSGSFDQTVKLWDYEQQQVIHTFRGHEENIRTVAFDPRGHYIASGDADGVIKVWRLADRQLLQTIEAHDEEVTMVVFHPDGKRLYSASEDKTIKAWDCRDGILMNTLAGHEEEVNAIRLLPDGQQMVSYSNKGKILLWDLKKGTIAVQLGGYDVQSVAVYIDYKSQVLDISPDGKYAILKEANTSLFIIDIKRVSKVRTLTLPGIEERDVILNVRYSPDGKSVAAVTQKGRFYLLDVNSGATRIASNSGPAASEGNKMGALKTVCWHPGGQVILSSGKEPVLRLWNRNGSSQAVELNQQQAEAIARTALSEDGRLLVLSGGMGYLRFLDLRTGRTWLSQERIEETVYGLALHPSGRELITSYNIDDYYGVQFWEVESGRRIRSSPRRVHSERITALCWSPDGKEIASGDKKGNLKIWDAATFRATRVIGGPGQWPWGVHSLIWHPTEPVLISAHGPSNYQYWDLESGRMLRMLKGYVELKGNCFFGFAHLSASGKYLAGPTVDCKKIVLWDARNGRTLFELGEYGFDQVIRDYAFSEDEQYLVTGGADKTIRIWQVTTGELLKKIEAAGHDQQIRAVRITPDGRRLLSIDDSGVIQIRSFPDGALLLSLYPVHEQAAYFVLSSNGQYDISEGADPTLLSKFAGFYDGRKLLTHAELGTSAYRPGLFSQNY